MPEKIDIYATATFSQCPNVQLTQDDLDSLHHFITSEEYLKKNVAIIHYDRVYTLGENHTGSYEHSVQPRIVVKRLNLWEGARSYIWKHLGSDIWERSNGTLIKLSHIHQK